MLADQVAIAPGRHLGRRRGDHVEVGHDGARGGAGEGALEAVLAQRRARGGVAVHRGGGRHAGIGTAGEFGGVFHDVVQHARPDGDRHDGLGGGLGADRSCKRLGRLGGSLHARRARQEDRRQDGAPGGRQQVGNPPAGHPPGVLVGHDQNGTLETGTVEDGRQGVEQAHPDLHVPRRRGLL